MSRQWKVVLTLAALVGLVMFVMSVTPRDKPEPLPAYVPTAEGALKGCRSLVERKLKAPSTAEFPADERLTGTPPPWIISGSVDAENSFGAMIRTQWVCEIRYTDRWIGTATLIP